MRRSSLATLTVLGALICLIGGTGLFAALNDNANTGTNSVDSAALAPSADIQIARATIPGTTPPNYTCGALSEELGTGFFTASNVGPGYAAPNQYFCVRNVGSQPVILTALATEFVSVDVACTGDEALFEGTCGDNKAGELSDVLNITYQNIGSCISNQGAGVPQTQVLADSATTPVDLGPLAPGQTLCYQVSIAYPSATANGMVQAAQSDRVTWRITFTGHA